MPDDFRKTLSKSPKAETFFSKLAPSHRKRYVQYVIEAKRPETRARRIENSIGRLREGEKHDD